MQWLWRSFSLRKALDAELQRPLLPLPGHPLATRQCFCTAREVLRAELSIGRLRAQPPRKLLPAEYYSYAAPEAVARCIALWPQAARRPQALCFEDLQVTLLANAADGWLTIASHRIGCTFAGVPGAIACHAGVACMASDVFESDAHFQACLWPNGLGFSVDFA